MNFDSDWLMEHLDGAPDADTLADRLTDCGCLVELREKGDGAENLGCRGDHQPPRRHEPPRSCPRGRGRHRRPSFKPLDFELDESDEDAAESGRRSRSPTPPCAHGMWRG